MRDAQDVGTEIGKTTGQRRLCAANRQAIRPVTRPRARWPRPARKPEEDARRSQAMPEVRPRREGAQRDEAHAGADLEQAVAWPAR
jgi:hypothetical protein